MHHSKELAFTFKMMLVFSRCTVSFNNYSTLHTTGWFSCNRIIIIFKSESFKPRIFITTTYNCIEFLLFVTYNVHLKTYTAISNAHLSRVCKRGKLSGSCLSTLNGFGSTQLPIFLCHIGVPTFSSQNN